ncbi:MAG: response regulator [Spirochaetales bacterium]|nr:response regulator [Spirochaetales bacterium]
MSELSVKKRKQNSREHIKMVRVLVVDDQEFVREYLIDVLKELEEQLEIRLEIKTAYDSESIRYLINGRRPFVPDLVILDIELESQENGIDLCRSFKHDTKYKRINKAVVIIISGHASDETIRKEALSAGAQAVIDKPIDSSVKKIIGKRISEIAGLISERKEQLFNKEIIDFYIRRQLVSRIMELGHLPDAEEDIIGIGFLDINKYTRLSKIMKNPQRNITLLNGLYSAFDTVLSKYNGYLNKTEGDSFIFHYGGTIDPLVNGLDDDQKRESISQRLFNTCVEIKKIQNMFNSLDERIFAILSDNIVCTLGFLDDSERENLSKVVTSGIVFGHPPNTIKEIYDMIRKTICESRFVQQERITVVKTIEKCIKTSASIMHAFDIINTIRSEEKEDLIIAVRLGADIGTATFGNVGPEGGKQYDVFGDPVITAKRMESTSPLDGFRVTERLYKIIDRTGIADEYFNEFARTAKERKGYYGKIKKNELFKFQHISLPEKNDTGFRTYAVQTNPLLPEDIVERISFLLSFGKDPSLDEIIDLIIYFRANRLVIDAIEDLFLVKGVRLKKYFMLSTISKKEYQDILEEHHSKIKETHESIQQSLSLWKLFTILKKAEDAITANVSFATVVSADNSFKSNWHNEKTNVLAYTNKVTKHLVRRTCFYEVTFRLFFQCIKLCLLEYFNNNAHTL